MNNRFYQASGQYAAFDHFVPAPCLRHAFTICGLRNASVSVCTPGFYDIYVNGKKITRGLLSPCIANPDERLYYDTYDLTSLLRDGENVIALLLGNGNLNAVGGQIWNFDRADYRSAPKLALDFLAETDSGSITFDASVFVTAPSAIIFDDLRAGEWYDARTERNGWMLPGYDDGDWMPVFRCEAPRGQMNENRAAPITVLKELSPIRYRPGRIGIYPEISKPVIAGDIPDEKENHGWLFDFGVNSSGICQLKIRDSEPGQKIILQFGEILGDLRVDGSGFADRGDECGLDLRGFHYLPHRFNHRDVYVCRGDAEEIWEPHFTYHGFRYVLVFGLREEQVSDTLLTFRVMSSLCDSQAEFHCSDETANRVWNAVVNSDQSNFFHIPTDCPHREKNGWTGDAFVSAEQLLTAFSCEDNLRQWLADIRSAMREDGDVPGIIPTNHWGYNLGPVWGSVITELPYQIWIQRGDTDVLSENASAVLRFLDKIGNSRDKRGLIPYGLGDWCEAARDVVDDPKAPSEFTSSVIAMDSCRKAALMFAALGRSPQKAMAETLYHELRDSIRRELIDLPNQMAVYRCQTAQAMAIAYGIFDKNETKHALTQLVGLIRNNNGFLDCGMCGLRVIFRVLAENGYADLAYNMAMRSEFPSYGYMVENGATALHELFSPMERVQSSCNHHFYGDILCFMMRYLCGIRYAENRLEIAPCFVSELHDASGSLQIPAGIVSVSWKRDNDKIAVSMTVPQDITAVFNICDGWQTEQGFTRRNLKPGDHSFILIRETAPDVLKRTSEK